ncbi:MAG: hypothetical protein QM589_03980 [Thermomicrobiales bacterium]
MPVSAAPDASYLIGTNLYVKGVARDKRAEQRARLTSIFTARAKAGDTAIILDIPIFQSSWSSTDIGAKSPDTPSMDDVAWAVEQAHALGLIPIIKPLLDEATIVATGPTGAWRGTIQPDDPDAWFASYTDLLAEYLRIAGTVEGSWLVIGAELGSLEASSYDGEWTQTIETLHKTTTDHPVHLMYSQNWDMVGQVPDWFTDIDGLAISVFYPLKGASPDASVDDLAALMEGYTPVLDGIREMMPGKTVIAGEAGIISSGDVYARPWAWSVDSADSLNMEAQRRYVVAACTTYAPHVDGIFWWTLYSDKSDDPAHDRGYSFEGKPAEREVNACSATYGHPTAAG